MTKNTLFLVHGMGRYPDDQWAEEVWQKLVACSERYSHFKTRKKLEDYAEPFAIRYDQFFEQALSRWDREATAFADFARGAQPAIGSSLDWLTGIDTQDSNFLVSHLLDVVIYRFFPYEAGQIRAHVLKAIFDEIRRKRAQSADAGFSLMAYSLGTSVAHDALADLASVTTIDGVVNTFHPKNFRFESIHMVANVSRMLQTKPKAYQSNIRPGRKGTEVGFCTRMYSHRHEMDPIARFRSFDPAGWNTNYTGTIPDHYRGWNVHDWLHYLDHPSVHIPILRSIAKQSAINPNHEAAAADQYPQFGGDLENLNVARAKIAEIHALIQGFDRELGLSDNYQLLLKVWESLQELRDLAGDSWRSLEGGQS